MLTREIEPRTGFGSTSQTPTSTAPDSLPLANVSALDIGSFVDNYNRMAEYLYPFELANTAILYVIRWENYALTLTTLILLCILFYHPALLAGSLVGVSIAGMAVGKYYSQAKFNTLLKLKETPHVEYLNEDSQALSKCKKNQKDSHRLLLEYKQVICRTEAAICSLTKGVEYLYKIILWESLEVSLCVTVLLCVLFALLCTVYLRVLSASFPLIILCFNRYFIKRTVLLWKSSLSYFYGRIRRKKKTAMADSQVAEVVHEVPPQNNLVESGSHGATSGGSSEPQDSHTSSGGLSQDREVARAAAADSSAVDKEDSLHSKGFCTNCSASFAKLLKRKHDCNYCGQTFCGSCTVKVKRAVLGATSPAAFEESVRVCLDCKSLLDNLKLDNSIPAS